MNAAKAAEAARAATVVAVTRHRPGLNGGRVGPPGPAPLPVPTAAAAGAPDPALDATGPYAEGGIERLGADGGIPPRRGGPGYAGAGTL